MHERISQTTVRPKSENNRSKSDFITTELINRASSNDFIIFQQSQLHKYQFAYSTILAFRWMSTRRAMRDIVAGLTETCQSACAACLLAFVAGNKANNTSQIPPH